MAEMGVVNQDAFRTCVECASELASLLHFTITSTGLSFYSQHVFFIGSLYASFRLSSSSSSSSSSTHWSGVLDSDKLATAVQKSERVKIVIQDDILFVNDECQPIASSFSLAPLKKS